MYKLLIRRFFFSFSSSFNPRTSYILQQCLRKHRLYQSEAANNNYDKAIGIDCLKCIERNVH